MENLEYKAQEERQQKDYFFGGSPDSPIPTEDKQDFDGLNYFSVKPELRFELELEEYDDKEKITVEDTKKGEQTYIRWGKFHFEIDGEKQTLYAFKGDSRESGLWVPFKDKTNGKETYGAGRYLDLVSSEYKKDEKWILDFNQAYNPFCAYSVNYVCPMVPFGNHLNVEIKAGEKVYHR